MVWIYDSPFTKDEREAFLGLKKELKRDAIAKSTVKLLSLMSYLRNSQIRTVEDVQASAFYDSAKTRPIFTKKTAKDVLQKLKQKGGRVHGNYPFFDSLLKDGIGYVTPNFIQQPIISVHETLLKNPTENVKNWLPILKILSNALHSGTSIAANNLSAVGEGIGGPIGAAAIAPFVALASIPSLGLATAEGDLGQLVASGLAIVPVIGDPAANALKQTEGIIKTAVDSNSNLPEYIPYVGYYVNKTRGEKIEDAQRLLQRPAGGKRFSTQRNRYSKWQKTRRNKSAKV
jgi:hypothetical protein